MSRVSLGVMLGVARRMIAHRRIMLGAAIGLALLAGVGGLGLRATSAQASPAAFPDAPAEPPAPHGQAVAVLAGGCFWGMEGLFEHIKGVISVTAGYAGGSAATAHYDVVSSEATSHAEAVRITYDPAVVRYGTLLKVYFALAHDPTEVSGQYPDEGRSYRSAIFPQTEAQCAEASAYIAALAHAHVFARPIATRLENGAFYPAEAYHQHFMVLHPDHPYILAWDAPRLARLRTQFVSLYR